MRAGERLARCVGPAGELRVAGHADTVLVMENGCLIEQGTHRQLLRKRGHYAALYKKFIS